jgi:hypothetical protein
MRTNDKITAIKAAIEEPRQVVDFISQEEIDYLINIYDQSNNTQDPYAGKIKKNTGPVTLDIKNYLTDPIVSKLIEKLKLELGEFKITAGFWFKTDYPHIIHNDDTFELPNTVYKAITIPLKIYGENIIDYPYLCFFDQFYFHGPAKFFKGEEFVPTYYNKQVYDYSDIDNIKENLVDEEIYKKYFTHLKRTWLNGLSFHSAIRWIPTTAIIFDSVRLHCASDFRKQNIKEKLAISIFTKK